jgi:biofilm PGA synthesis lipoprotein PgaB
MSWELISLLRNIFKTALPALVMLFFLAYPAGAASNRFITLVYHDIPVSPQEKDDIPQKDFINQLEFFKTHGYRFISPKDILAASQGLTQLPDKAILLTFDDAYASFYKFVYPVLQLYQCPAVLSVVTSWIDNPQSGIYQNKELMTWPQIKEVADSGLVTIASHSHDLHRFVKANPAGNLEEAPSNLIYFAGQERYESEEEFRSRLRTDLAQSMEMLRTHLGFKPYILTWPYGAFNEIGLEEAQKVGFKWTLTLEEGFSHLRNLLRINRYYVIPQVYWPKSGKRL